VSLVKCIYKWWALNEFWVVRTDVQKKTEHESSVTVQFYLHLCTVIIQMTCSCLLCQS